MREGNIIRLESMAIIRRFTLGLSTRARTSRCQRYSSKLGLSQNYLLAVVAITPTAPIKLMCWAGTEPTEQYTQCAGCGLLISFPFNFFKPLTLYFKCGPHQPNVRGN